MRRELAYGKRRLKIAKDVCTSVEHDRSMVEESRQMAKCQLDLSMSMNKDLTRELKATHYKCTRFFEGARTRPSMGEASIVAAKFPVSA